MSLNDNLTTKIRQEFHQEHKDNNRDYFLVVVAFSL